jgi:histidyl-tRNA synthetase
MPAIQPVKGTRDFYPEDMAFRGWLYQKIREVSERFGYQEYEGPFLERLELYAAKSGEELVKEQSFVFADRGGEMITLRPELTPTLARMVATRSGSLGRPLRWWSFGPFWRYERPQKGRSREFFQWNIDLLGVDSPETDAELAAVAAEFFRAVGLPPRVIRIAINSRKLVESQLESIGIPPVRRPEVLRLIDRRQKTSQGEWERSALEGGLDRAQLDALKQALNDQEAWKASDELVRFFAAAEEIGASEYLVYDPTVVRGLDYYTGIVFEARDDAGEYRSILGGGRYDNLVADVGGEPIPATGFAMGDMVLSLVLDKYGARPALRAAPAQVLVTVFAAGSEASSLQLAAQLRREGLKVEWYPQADRLPKQLKYADRQGIPLALIVGPEEEAAGEVTLKDLQARTQERVPKTLLGARLRRLLETARGA